MKTKKSDKFFIGVVSGIIITILAGLYGLYGGEVEEQLFPSEEQKLKTIEKENAMAEADEYNSDKYLASLLTTGIKVVFYDKEEETYETKLIDYIDMRRETFDSKGKMYYYKGQWYDGDTWSKSEGP